jgi:hypothetical protein
MTDRAIKAPARPTSARTAEPVSLPVDGNGLGELPSTIRRMISNGLLPAQQPCKGAPWIIHLRDLERKDVREEAAARRARRPSSGDSRQESLDF